MFGSNYYCLVAGLREYTLEADAKGFDARAIVSEILEGVSRADARQVRLLYTYYDCEHLAALHAGRTVSEGLGNLTPDELAEELRSPRLLPDAVQQVLRAYADPEGEEAAEIDTAQRFEKALFGAYYAACEQEGCRALAARAASRPVEEVVVGGGDVAEQLQRSSAADFGLRGELPYIDAVIAAVNDEANLVEKEHKIDLIRWNESLELATFDYFDIAAILSYLVRINIVARWMRLDAARGREMFDRLVAGLDGRKFIEQE